MLCYKIEFAIKTLKFPPVQSGDKIFIPHTNYKNIEIGLWEL